MKIKTIEISGFRGIKGSLKLDLNSRSCLIYGENGSGKSSITDAIEWFYNEKVEHLSQEEIDRRGGITALRNISLPNNIKSIVSLSFLDSRLDCKKEIDKECRTTTTNSTDFSNQYIANSKRENLILRYANLTELIFATKKERLDKISQIIGLQDVLKVRDSLKKGRSEIERRLRQRNFDNEISRREGEIFEKLGERIVDDTVFIRKINEMIKDLEFQPITTIQDIESLLNQFKSVDDSVEIKKRNYLERSKNQIFSLKEKIQDFCEKYQQYYSLFEKLSHDVEMIKQLSLEELWRKGEEIIEKKLWEKDLCPLCFQNKNKEELFEEIENRLNEIKPIKEKKAELENLQKDLENLSNNFINLLSVIKHDEYYNSSENRFLQEFIKEFKKWKDDIDKEIKKELLKLEKLSKPEEIKIDQNIFEKTIKSCNEQYEELGTRLRGQKILELQDKISLSWERYREIKQFKKEKQILENYLESFTLIYNEFMRKLKSELDSFINQFSNEINEYYNYMHPSENVYDFQTKIIEERDDLKGLTIEYKFHNINTYPPQKYMSESHLNSLGIAFFLTSVKAFNRENKFFILDDIVSSFDTEHRKRLADLLIEKFNDYQIIVLTHEKDWFELMKNLVKGRANWYIQALKWSEAEGTHLDESFIDLNNIIESKIKNNDEIGLGNLIRKYLEKILKEICEELEVYVKYRNNETNEKRMSAELLSCLKSKVNKQPSKGIFTEKIDKLLNNSLFIGNIDSHYDTFRVSIGDCKAFWDDVEKFKNLFYCDKCEKSVSVRYYSEVDRKIRCKCGALTYDWNK